MFHHQHNQHSLEHFMILKIDLHSRIFTKILELCHILLFDLRYLVFSLYWDGCSFEKAVARFRGNDPTECVHGSNYLICDFVAILSYSTRVPDITNKEKHLWNYFIDAPFEVPLVREINIIFEKTQSKVRDVPPHYVFRKLESFCKSVIFHEGVYSPPKSFKAGQSKWAFGMFVGACILSTNSRDFVCFFSFSLGGPLLRFFLLLLKVKHHHCLFQAPGCLSIFLCLRINVLHHGDKHVHENNGHKHGEHWSKKSVRCRLVVASTRKLAIDRSPKFGDDCG
mmetsp:Transcript_57310/g.113010  ORF Transcript_57310/g.113010 Transcript_57310/m.113010 type:complete len:281 (-) Transcript_57310:606-1448(-)